MTVRPITPTPFSIRDITTAIDEGLLETLEEGKVLLKLSYFNWDRKPEFETEGPKTVSGARVLEYSTESTPWVWVDEGTKPHKETAKNWPTMRFTTDSRPKTQKGQLLSSAGSFGSNWVSKIEVDNPGITSREFSTETARRLEEEVIELRVQDKLDKVS